MYSQTYVDGTRAYIAVHVDDFGIAAPNSMVLDRIKREIASIYSITVIEDLTYYLGMYIVRDRINKSIILSQPGYIDDLLITYKIVCDGSQLFPATPMLDLPHPSQISPHPLTRDKLLSPLLITEYQARVGSLLYLATQTRPDILFAVNMASRKCKSPTLSDLVAVHRILLYVAGTRQLGLHFHSGEGIILYATVDASYANHIDRKSHTGCTLHIGRTSGSVITRCTKQTITADSSTVAEFIAAHTATKEILWARTFLTEMGYPPLGPTTLFEDNKSTIAMINNQCNSQRTKHIDIRYNMIREQAALRTIQMLHLPTNDMTSDILTKALTIRPFQHLRPLLLGVPSSPIS